MRSSILTVFLTFPAEASIIGRLLAGYAELEISLLNCVTMGRGDLDVSLKTIFRARGETQRLNIADALGRQAYAAHGLETEFSMAIGAVRHCLKVRNTYAHCNWYDNHSGQLAFVNLEELAETNAFVKDLTSLTAHNVDVPLLTAQEAYFVYADALAAWVNYEGRFRAGTLSNLTLAKPKPMKQPPLHIP